MGFKSKLCFRYSTTHENRIWNKLVEALRYEFGNRPENLYLIGNLIVEGKELDALVIKEDAIIVVDFKDYGGVLTVSENHPWTASGVTINSGRKNPFAQLFENKYAVLNFLKHRLPAGYENWINIGHINVMALFHQAIDYDIGRLQADLSPAVSRWFNICDFDHVIQTVNEITSKQTSLKNGRAEVLLNTLNVDDILADQQVDNASIKNSLSHHDNIEMIDQETNFANLYYSKAKSIDSIKLLIIGQDPYPSNSNGVAFCKNSYYELFQEECSGGIVLKSMGLDKEAARAMCPKNPKNLFYELLTSHGICFINVLNKVYNKLSIEEIHLEAERTRQFNMPFIKKSKTIVLLGKGRTKSLFEQYYPDAVYQHVFIHPSPKARTGNELEWTETWEGNRLATILIN